MNPQNKDRTLKLGQPGAWLPHERLEVYCAALLICEIALLVTWIGAHWILHTRGVPAPGYDFQGFWGAGYLTNHQGPVAAYDARQIFAIEAPYRPAGLAGPDVGVPWIYPPTFELFMSPFGMMPYGSAYCIFSIGSLIAFVLAVHPAMRSTALPWICLLAAPGIWIVLAAGQNSLMTAAMAIGALTLLRKNPICAGICAGMLVVKPQFLVLFPLIFLAGRHYKAVAALLITVLIWCVVTTLVLGLPAWIAFLHEARWVASEILQKNDAGMWSGMPSIYVAAKSLGASNTVAAAAHYGVAIPVLLATLVIWRKSSDARIQAISLIISTIVFQPYIFYYDLTWLAAIPIFVLSYSETSLLGKRHRNTLIVISWVAAPLAYLVAFHPKFVGLPAVVLVVLAAYLVIFFGRRSLTKGDDEHIIKTA